MKRNSVFTKIAALMLCVMMVIGCLPVSVFAADQQFDWETAIDMPDAVLSVAGADGEGNNALDLSGLASVYTYTWTATAEGTLTIQMPAWTMWEYTLSNETQKDMEIVTGSTESAEVNAAPKIDVAKGDEVVLEVLAVNASGNLISRNIYASFVEAQGTMANPYKVNIDGFYNYYTVLANKTAYFTLTSDDPEYGGTTEFQGDMVITAYGEFSGYCGLQPITAVEGEYGTYVATVAIQYNVNMMAPQFTIDASEEIGVNIRFEVPVGTFANPAEMNVGDAESHGVNEATSEYFFEYNAYEDGTLTIAMNGDAWGYGPTFVHNDIPVGGEMLWSDEGAPATQTYEVTSGDKLTVVVMTNGTESVSFDAWFVPAGAEEPEETDPPATEEPEPEEPEATVAMIGDQGFATVADALNAAGQVANEDNLVTVTLVAEATEGVLIIQPYVILDIKDIPLTANALIGLNGSYLIGTTNSAVLNVGQNNLLLSANPMANGTNYYVPAWVGTHYTIVNGNLSYYSKAYVDGKITIVFQQIWGSSFRKGYLMNNNTVATDKPGGEDNGIHIVIESTWSNDQATFKQQYVYNEGFVGKTSEAASNGYSFEINTSGRTGMKCAPMIVFECGVVVSLTPYEPVV